MCADKYFECREGLAGALPGGHDTHMGGRKRFRLFRHAGAPAAPIPAPEVIEACCVVLRHSVAERRAAQLDQLMRDVPMLSRQVVDRFDLTREDQRHSWLRASGGTAAWSQVMNAWRRTPRRLVILGEPGYGKTVGALALLTRANATGRPGKAVAELFSLVDWFRWQAQHPGGDLTDWLGDQLAMTYPDVPAAGARAMVTERFVVPFLDDLDEVPESHRRDCVAAIDAYARAGEPRGGLSAARRPFVLACRSEEYNNLAPGWVTADRQIELCALEPGEVNAALEQQLPIQPRWDAVRGQLLGGDGGSVELFRSPLVLGIALRAYRDPGRDPGELLTAGPEDAEGRLWELFLTSDDSTFDGAAPGQVRRWLGFLARSLGLQRRQLWLHEFYLLAGDNTLQRQFTRKIARRMGLLVGLADGLLGFLAAGWVTGVSAGLAAGLVTLMWLLRSRIPLMLLPFYQPGPEVLAPQVWARVPWRDRAAAAGKRLARDLSEWLPGDWIPDELMIWAVRSGALLAVGGGLATFIGLDSALFVAIGLVALPFLGMFDVGSQTVTHEVPRRLAGGGPDVVIRSAWLKASFRGLYFLLAGVAAGGLIGALHGKASGGLLTGLGVGLVFGTVAGFNGGLKACFYNAGKVPQHCARQGLLPPPLRLPAFLDWCTHRDWLRRADAYEFRYPAFKHYLALAAIQEQVDSYQRRAADPRASRELASALQIEAVWLRSLGRTRQALAAVETAVRVYRELGTADPVVRFQLAYALETQVACLRELGQTEKAATVALQASHAYGDVRMHDDMSTAKLAAVMATRAACLHELGRVEEALTANQEAIGAYRAVAGVPGHRKLASSLARLVSGLRRLGQDREELAEKAEFQLTHLEGLATSLVSRAAWLAELRRDGEALDAAQAAQETTGRAAQVARRLAGMDPEFRVSLAGVLAEQAEWLWASGRPDEAMAAVAESLRVGSPLAAADAELRADIAVALDTQAAWLHELGRTEEAQASLSEAVSLYWQLETGQPGAYQPELEASLNRQAGWLRQLSRPGEARTAARLAKSVAAKSSSDDH
jgi:tetratricopeptide (TPR) repeat protein